MMGKVHSKKRIVFLLAGICIVQIVVSLFWASQKNYLFFDEVFSFQASNTARKERVEFEENVWMNETWYESFMSVDEEDAFDYSIPFNNQKTDVHPPLYYMMLHTVCSIVPGEVSLMAGISVNLMFFLGSTVVLYFLTDTVWRRKEIAVLAAFLYAVSFGGINTMIYTRMYMMVTFMALLHSLVYMKYMEQDKISGKAYLFLMVTLIGGVLTQYYFLFIAFFFGVWYTVKFFVEKRYKVLFVYWGTFVTSALISLGIWPSMLTHLFGGGRGEEAADNLLSSEGYFESLKEMFRILNNDMFAKLLPVIILGIVLLWIVGLKKGTPDKELYYKKMLPILFVCIGYFLLVTKVAPYQVDRYVMPIYPLVYMMVIGLTCMIAEKVLPKKLVLALCVIGFGGLSLIHMIHSGIPYTYVKNQNNIERWAVVNEYRDNYALYISDDKGAHYYDAVQMLKEYQGFYYACNLENVQQIISDMEDVADKGLVVYVKNTRTREEAEDFVQKVFPGQKLNQENLLDEDEKWSVYLINK